MPPIIKNNALSKSEKSIKETEKSNGVVAIGGIASGIAQVLPGEQENATITSSMLTSSMLTSSTLTTSSAPLVASTSSLLTHSKQNKHVNRGMDLPLEDDIIYIG